MPPCDRSASVDNQERGTSILSISRSLGASSDQAFGGADFWRLWYAGLVAFLVRWIETLAVAVFVLDRTGSPFLVAMMTMLRLLPMGLFGSFLGAWAERIERRTALMAMIAAMAATDAGLAVLAGTGLLTVWHIAIGSFINGLGWAADNPVRRVAMGEVAGTERMGTAMSIDVAANNGTRILGPVIGGVLLGIFSIEAVFALGAALYATSLYTLVTLGYRNHGSRPSRASVLAGIMEAARAAWQDKRLVATLWVTILFNVFAWPFTSMVPVVAQQSLGLGAAATGVLASMDGVGAVLGAFGIGVAAARSRYGGLYVGGMALYAMMVVGFALSPGVTSAGLALIVEGLGSAAFSIMQATLVYQYAPAEMRSRMLGLVSTCIGLGPIGFVHLGWMASVLGAREATLVTGIEGLILLAVTWPVWRVLLSRD